MKLNIAVPYRNIPNLEVQSVTLPAVEGETMILPGHAHWISLIGEGALTYETQSGTKSFFLKGGVAEVREDQVLILADEMEERKT